jgi:hypothetical protein
MTPEMLAQQQEKNAQDKAQSDQQTKAIELDMSLKQAQIEKLKADATKTNTETLFSGIQAGQLAVQIPGILPVSDSLLKSAGFVDKNGAPLAIAPNSVDAPYLQLKSNTSPMLPSRPESPLNGINHGIETMGNDSVLQ